MNRPSEQLRRGLDLAARKGQSVQLATALRAGMAYGLGALEFTPIRGMWSGAVAFEAQINGHAFTITVEAIDRASVERLFDSPAVPTSGEERAGRSGGGNGGD